MKDKIINFKLSKEDHENIKEYAKSKNMLMSEYIRYSCLNNGNTTEIKTKRENELLSQIIELQKQLIEDRKGIYQNE
jgi:hypothetical protein